MVGFGNFYITAYSRDAGSGLKNGEVRGIFWDRVNPSGAYSTIVHRSLRDLPGVDRADALGRLRNSNKEYVNDMHRALTTRTGALTLAIILAAAAALMVFVYVKGYQSDVNGRSNEVSVLVANQTIPQLTPGNQVVEATMYRTTTVPTELAGRRRGHQPRPAQGPGGAERRLSR